MSNLKRDELRVIVCFAGIAGLFIQLLAQTFMNATVGQGLTGSFVTLVALSIGDAAWERYASKRGPSDPPQSDELPPGIPTRPPSDRSRDQSDISSLTVAA